MVVLECWSFFQADPLVINQLFVALLLSLPVLTALCFAVIPRFWSGKTLSSWGRWILGWMGSTALALIVAFAVCVAWGLVLPYRTALASSSRTDSEIAEYNYLHFGYGRLSLSLW